MGFVDADDPIIYLMAVIFKHTLLLGIKSLDDPVLALKLVVQRKDLMSIQLLVYCLEVPFQELKLGFDSSTDSSFGGIFVLGYFQVLFSGYFPIRSGLLP